MSKGRFLTAIVINTTLSRILDAHVVCSHRKGPSLDDTAASFVLLLLPRRRLLVSPAFPTGVLLVCSAARLHPTLQVVRNEAAKKRSRGREKERVRERE